jgi:hypothetical protein
MPFQSDKRLYLTADDQVVEEGDERAVSLLVGEGGQLSDAQAAKYGLGSAPEATPQASPKAMYPPPNPRTDRRVRSPRPPTRKR